MLVNGTLESSKLEEVYLTYVLETNMTKEWITIVTKAVAESVKECKLI